MGYVVLTLNQATMRAKLTNLFDRFWRTTRGIKNKPTSKP